MYPRSWRRRVRAGGKRKAREALQKAHKEERRFVVRELLPETDARARVKRAEDVRIAREVGAYSHVEEALRVKCQRCA